MLDASEIDRISQLASLPLMRLLDWKNRAGEPFEMRCRQVEGGMFAVELNTPQPTSVPAAVPLVHGDYESHKQEDGSILYKSLPGNSMGQVNANDGRPAFGVAYDMTELDAQGRPVFKVYFGSATEWFVKNVYHQKWNELREVKRELEPEAASTAPPFRPPGEELQGKERGRNPRDRARNEQRAQGGPHYRGSGGGQGRGSGGGQGRGGGRGRR